ncbi:unnamed protein product [Mytilus edulis]|uniref:Uncharacterized protein n=1 Tax=Mytilus edulis TaxID=6550 RepID=A0A8S3SAP2_MYTED|nr:unnamed protein product [Mytilus edulis]
MDASISITASDNDLLYCGGQLLQNLDLVTDVSLNDDFQQLFIYQENPDDEAPQGILASSTTNDDFLISEVQGNSAIGESIGDDSSSIATELSDMMVIDEVGYEDTTDEPSDNRKVHDEGIYQQYVHNQRSAGAPGPAPYTVTASSSEEIESNSITTFKSRTHQCFVCGLKQRLTYEGANIAEPISQSEDQLAFVDSYFHLDQILRRMRLRNFQHLQHVQSVLEHGCSQYFYYGVANYVFPLRGNNWASDVGFARGVYVFFGKHPHITAEGISKRQMDQLDSLTDSHLDGGDGSAATRTLEIILHHDLTDMKFYRHYFDGTIEEMTA